MPFGYVDTMMKITTKTTNRFQKGTGCYKCRSCKKLTRSTGRGDNENVGLCERCFDMGGDENAVLDGMMTVEEFEQAWGCKPNA